MIAVSIARGHGILEVNRLPAERNVEDSAQNDHAGNGNRRDQPDAAEVSLRK
jgi:hypothetical protein